MAETSSSIIAKKGKEHKRNGRVGEGMGYGRVDEATQGRRDGTSKGRGRNQSLAKCTKKKRTKGAIGLRHVSNGGKGID